MLNNYSEVNQPKDFYHYFLECYKLDYKEFLIENILSSKFKYKWFVKRKEELFNKNLPYTLFDNPKAKELEKDIELYRLEKKLFYGCFFVLGQSNKHFSKDKRFCAPLFLFPANLLNIDNETFITIDFDSFVINPSVLSVLELRKEHESKNDFIQNISNYIGKTENVHLNIKQLLDHYFFNLDTANLLEHPNLWSRKKITSYFSKHDVDSNTYKLVPAAGSIFIEKAESSLRVINDLTEIIKLNQFNSSLKELFYEKEIKNKFKKSYFNYLLNTQQYKALENANKFNNSVIVGPPGTGKSYTLTSIIADASAKGESVLVVSRTKLAVEVLRNMLERDFNLKQYLVHTSGRNYKMSLNARLSNYLNGLLVTNNVFLNNEQIKRLTEQIGIIENKLLRAIKKEMKFSELEFNEISMFNKIRKWLIEFTQNHKNIWQLFEQRNQNLNSLKKEIRHVTKKNIEYNVVMRAHKNRKDISTFRDAINATSFTEYKELLAQLNFKNILNIFPIWLANLSDLNAIIPLEKDLFDLVVIDEATQCDIATALPAIYRAKRVVITGDPNQLRHYSFVSYEQQDQLRERFNLPRDKVFDYRNRSILDLYIAKLQNQSQLSFLTEHFRSTPSLI